ncbi:MAG: aconitate hydratase B, partial [Candidatus Aminicenantes bacterium]|nr:aconitate hydratase B [Candidatus Aminicenantes bacterium]
MLNTYFRNERERKAQGIPPLPLDPEQTQELCKILENPPMGKEAIFLDLLKNRIPPGVDPAAKVKAGWLSALATGRVLSPVLDKKGAVELLGTMLGGFNVEPLIALL